ncbi:L-lactate dehydrogenase-like isoform X2 [Onthophagus taurus]|uniref:L-lactate dehydrogenase-like isoform X2 n=1 Tax=Onthophagus taurus TaxID=166361 RepID=UPI0039BDEF21
MAHLIHKSMGFHLFKQKIVKFYPECFSSNENNGDHRNLQTYRIHKRTLRVCSRFVNDFPKGGFSVWRHKRISADGIQWKYPVKITEIGPYFKIPIFKTIIRKRLERKSSPGKVILVKEPLPQSKNKVTIVGAGMVGLSTAFSIASQSISNDVCIVDSISSERLYGEVLDLQYGSGFLTNVNIRGSTDFDCSFGSKICIVTTGVKPRRGEPQLDFMHRNVQLMKTIIPPLVKQSPDTILVIVTDPVDIMTYIAWKLSGLPPERVIGSGTSLDSSRFRFLLSKKIGVSIASCHGWIIGEHGRTSVAVWSGVNVAGVRLIDLNPRIGTKSDPEHWGLVHKKVIEGANEVTKLKGNTCWSVGIPRNKRGCVSFVTGRAWL